MSQSKIVDANVLRSPLLEAYLKASPSNLVVFTDHACMESYKGTSLVNLARSLDIVSRYAQQVLVLMSTREIVALQSRSDYTTTAANLIDVGQTHGFRRFCEGVRYALVGRAPDLEAQLLAKSQVAKTHFDRVRADAELGSRAIRALAAQMDPALLKQLRTHAPISSDGMEKITTGVMEVAAILFRDHPDVDRMPSGKRLPSSLVFRYAVAGYVSALRWISDGGVDSTPVKRLANDLVDATHVAYATYFDGLLSADKRVNDLYQEADWLLRNVFTAEPV